MKTISMMIGPEHDRKTVHHVVLKVMKVSSGAYGRLKFTGGITLDGKQTYARELVKEGQILQVSFPDGSNSYPEMTNDEANVCIVYEDEDYYVIDKPAGLATMYSPGRGGSTLETALYCHLGCPGNYVFRPINRLDKGTSGLMAVAKHAHAQHLLQKELHTDRFVREYTALCKGCPPERDGIITAPIGKASDGIKRRVTNEGKNAVTEYHVLAQSNRASLVQMRLQTGRTHQIRVHMAYLGCPIWGDYVYGQEDACFPGFFALHSSRIAFCNPITGKIIQLVSKVPQMWYDLLGK